MSALFDLSVKFDAKKEVGYCVAYERVLKDWRSSTNAVLELGTNEGGSLQMWEEFFPGAQIFGVDMTRMWTEKEGSRIHTWIGDQKDTQAISEFMSGYGVETLDLIVDDASHFGYETKMSFLGLWPKLKSGGLYILEDWTTGYWSQWEDGQPIEAPDPEAERAGRFDSHPYGIPGFLKQLIDSASHFSSERHSDAVRIEGIRSIEVFDAFVFIWKS